MITSLPEEKFVKFSSLEGTDIGASDINSEVYVATIKTAIS